MPALQIQLRARRYVAAVQALYEARRCWSKLDVALVEQKDIDQAFEVLHELDCALADATEHLHRS